MSNLGAYQDVTTIAKTVGGMDNYIALIKDGAVAEKAPGIFGKGLLVGALAGAGALFVVDRVRTRRALRIELGKAAESDLKESTR